MFDYWLENPIPDNPDHEYIDEATERLLAEMEGAHNAAVNSAEGTENGENDPFYAFAPSEDADLADCPF